MQNDARITLDLLQDELCQLTLLLAEKNIRLYVGGGYGLLLRQRRIRAKGIRTIRPIPPERSTEDLDLYLTAELIVDGEAVMAIRDALAERGYRGVDAALYYQFSKEVTYRGQTRRTKIDLLAALPVDPEQLEKLKFDKRRVRPRTVTKIHAHPNPEARHITEYALEVELQGCEDAVSVMVPHPYVYASLKLHVYRDRRHDEEKEMGRHHAFDLYRLFSMITEEEWNQALSLRDKLAEDATILDARHIVTDLFFDENAPGVLAMREYAKKVRVELSADLIHAFIRDLTELFPTVT